MQTTLITTPSLRRVAGAVGLLVAATCTLGQPAMASPAGRAAGRAPAQAGELSISVPTAAELGSVDVAATTVTGPLGSVVVVDERLAEDASWQVSVSSSGFTTGDGGPDETVWPADVAYDPGAATATTGDGTFEPGPPQPLASVAVAFSHLGGSSANSASWNPTVTVTLGTGRIAGTYAGSITHSVA